MAIIQLPFVVNIKLFNVHNFILSVISTSTMINNTVVVQLKTSPIKNPYSKQLTPQDKLRLSQDERTSIKKSIALNIKDKKCLEVKPDVIQYLKACKLVGFGDVQLYLTKFEESKKLEARLSDVENDIKMHKNAAFNLFALPHENYQLPVLDDEAFVHPCDNMDYEEIDKAIENGKLPSIKAIAVIPATVTPKRTALTPEQLELCREDERRARAALIPERLDFQQKQEQDWHSRATAADSVPKLLVSDIVPNKIAPLSKRKYVAFAKNVARTSSMDDDSLEDDSPVIVTRSKGKVASCAKSIYLESCKKNEV